MAGSPQSVYHSRMAEIHPTAIVDAQAELANDVVVGPWCLIEGPVKLGPGCRLLHRVTLKGPLRIGESNLFYPNVCLGFSGQDLKYDHDKPGAGIAIGSGNIFREGVTVHRATLDRPTRVGDRNYFMVDSHLGHDVQVGSDCMLVNGVMVGGHCEIADRVILGGNATVHQHVRIGRLTMISGLSGLTQDVPPFMTSYRTRTIESLNIIGLRRAGLRDHIAPLKKAFGILFHTKLAMPNAVERIRTECGDDPLCMELADFVTASKRGITRYHAWRGDGTNE